MPIGGDIGRCDHCHGHLHLNNNCKEMSRPYCGNYLMGDKFVEFHSKHEGVGVFRLCDTCNSEIWSNLPSDQPDI